MRVIAGTARGRRLKEPKGLETRPTTDRVKESIFNIIQFDIPGRRVLDLFAGTGQMGIEAISRGAVSCVFIEQRTDAVRLVKENIALCGFQDAAEVRQTDALAYLSSAPGKFGLIFLDPPYATDLLRQSLRRIAAFDILVANGIILCESSADTAPVPLAPPYSLVREYHYGKSKITLYRRETEPVPPEGRKDVSPA